MDAVTKTCKTCKKEKPQYDFYKKSKGKVGFQTECIKCFNKRCAVNREKRMGFKWAFG